MHPLIITGLSNIGTSLLEQTLNKIRNIESCTFNLRAIMEHLSKRGCAKSTIRRMLNELATHILVDPLLNEFRQNTKTQLSLTTDSCGRCTFKEDGKPILTCSRDSSLGKMGIAFLNLSQIHNHQQLTEINIENND